MYKNLTVKNRFISNITPKKTVLDYESIKESAKLILHLRYESSQNESVLANYDKTEVKMR